jgi:carbonic anhydrase
MKNAAGTIRNLLAIGFITIIFAFGSTGLYAQPTMAHHVQTKDSQSATTPAAALQRLKDGNLRFVSDTGLHHPLFRQEISETAHGQFPFAAILSCIDSRVSVEDIFDLENGDAFNARVAGSTFGPIDLGGLEYATKVSGAKVLLVLGHTNCGAIKGACDDVHLGNLTALVGEIKPAVQQVSKGWTGGEKNSHNHEFVEAVNEVNIGMMMRKLLHDSPVIKEMVDNGTLILAGAIYDVETGKVRFLDQKGK